MKEKAHRRESAIEGDRERGEEVNRGTEKKGKRKHIERESARGGG